jgi:hypothetical protein
MCKHTISIFVLQSTHMFNSVSLREKTVEHIRIASYHGNLDTVRFLCETTNIFPDGLSLMYAVISNNLELVKYIFELMIKNKIPIPHLGFPEVAVQCNRLDILIWMRNCEWEENGQKIKFHIGSRCITIAYNNKYKELVYWLVVIGQCSYLDIQFGKNLICCEMIDWLVEKIKGNKDEQLVLIRIATAALTEGNLIVVRRFWNIISRMEPRKVHMLALKSYNPDLMKFLEVYIHY